jgi:hypothetical protein
MRDAYPMVEVGFVVLSEAPVDIEAAKEAVKAVFNSIKAEDVTPGSVRAYNHGEFENGEQDLGIEAYYDLWCPDDCNPCDIIWDMVDEKFPDEVIVDVQGFKVRRHLLEVST